MKSKSLLPFAWILLIAPAALACTVTVGDDDEESDEVTETDDATDEGDAGSSDETESDDGSETDDAGPETDDPAEADAGTDEVEPDEDGGATSDDAGADDEDPTDPGEGDDDAGAPEGDGGGDAPSGDTVKSGVIALSQQSLSVLDQVVTSTTAFASFSIFTPGSSSADPDALPCEVETVGSCTLSVCDTSDVSQDPPASGTSMQVSAGDVTIDGLAQELVLSSEASGNYTPVTGMTALWEGGETVTASAPGSADVPEFSLEVSAPSDVSLTAPELDLLTPLAVSRSADLEFTWSEGEDGTVTVMISESMGDDVSRSISCSVAATEGSVSVDASLLEDFTGQGALSAVITAAGQTTVDDWAISISASSSLASGLVEFGD